MIRTLEQDLGSIRKPVYIPPKPKVWVQTLVQLCAKKIFFFVYNIS